MPIMSAIPTGSLAPDSPSRIVPVRPATSRSPSTENMTAGSVGAIAAPSRPADVHPKPSAQCAKTATPPAVANVPRTPSDAIGTSERRNRRQPIPRPPSKRITISATVATWTTVFVETSRLGKRSEAIAATTRHGAANGIEIRCTSFVVKRATATAPATSRIQPPKTVTSCTST
jgi:hypothetical protein